MARLLKPEKKCGDIGPFAPVQTSCARKLYAYDNGAVGHSWPHQTEDGDVRWWGEGHPLTFGAEDDRHPGVEVLASMRSRN